MLNEHQTHLRYIGGIIAATMYFGTAIAADDHWQHEVLLYMVGASIDGKVGIGNIDADVDIGFDDILDNLDFGAMLAYRGELGPWAISADLIHLALATEKTGLGPLGNASAKADFDETTFELAGFYSLTNRLEAYGGLRYWDLSGSVVLTLGEPLAQTITADGSEDWIDPLVGLRFKTPLGEHWEFVARGDIGGFGIGSDFAWHTTLYAAWHPTTHTKLILGYRYLDVDYESGSGSDRFLWDVGQGGPTLGFGWRF